MPADGVLAETDNRAGFLESLRKTGVRDIPPVTEAILGYYEQVIDA
jgi:hypothetical protein